MNQKISALTLENRKLKEKLKEEKSKTKHTIFSWGDVETDKKVNFCTGLNSINIFHKIFDFIQPYLRYLKSWRGSKCAEKSEKRKT